MSASRAAWSIEHPFILRQPSRIWISREFAGTDRVFVLTAVNEVAIARQDERVRELVGAA